MLQRLVILLGVSVLCALIGAGSMVLAEGTPNAAAPAGALGFSAVSSATGLQSFLWVFDNGAREVTFCFSVATPETGPQYDFKCRTRTLAQASTP
jgi:hypothetical protein